MIESRSAIEAAHRRIPFWFGLLVAVALLLSRLPYRGLRHDGVLYAGQALAHLNPTWAARDFFFASGSQDRYSIFSNVVALLYSHFSIAATNIVLLLAAWLVFVLALFALGRDLSPRHRWLGVASVICASHFYGASRTFGFMEDFVTARTWAEPMALLALVCLIRARYLLAALCLALALALHPLVAIPVAVVAASYLVGLDRRWAWMLLLLVPIVALSVMGVPPFSDLLRSYDEQWFVATMRANWSVFESTWELEDFVEAAAVLGVLWLANRGQTSPYARLARATVWAALALCALSFIGADTQHNVLFTQLQLWRVLWVADLLAIMSLPAWLAREWDKGINGRVAAVAVFVAMVSTDDWIATGWALALWAILALVISARAMPLKPRVARLAIVGTFVAGLALTGLHVFSDQSQLFMHQQGLAIARTSSIPAQLPMLTIPLAFLLFAGWDRAGGRRIASIAAALLILSIAVVQWDQRSAWARFVETAVPGQHPFAALIPPGSQVYWHNDLAASWVLLERPQLISDNQLSGLLFNRATAITATARLPAFLAMTVPEGRCTALEWWGADRTSVKACQLPRDAFLAVCHAKPDHADYLVAPIDFGVGVIARWQFKPSDGSAPVTYALYDCKQVP